MRARIRAVTAPEDALARSFPEKVVAMRLVRTLVVTSLATIVLALAAAPAGAQSAPETPTLVDVRAGGHTGYDRVVFEFRGPRARAPHRLRRPARPGRLGQPGVGGRRRRPRGRLRGRQRPQRGRLAHHQPAAFSPGLTAVKEVAQIGDFEAVVTYGIGVDRRRPIEVSTLSSPSRLVIDVPTTEADGSAGSGDDSGSLPFTGAPSPELLVTGLALLATGAAALALARRTRAA